MKVLIISFEETDGVVVMRLTEANVENEDKPTAMESDKARLFTHIVVRLIEEAGAARLGPFAKGRLQ